MYRRNGNQTSRSDLCDEKAIRRGLEREAFGFPLTWLLPAKQRSNECRNGYWLSHMKTLELADMDVFGLVNRYSVLWSACINRMIP